MALTMLDKKSDNAAKLAWPSAIAAEFERERQNNNGCVGNMLSFGKRTRPRLANPASAGSAVRFSPPCA